MDEVVKDFSPETSYITTKVREYYTSDPAAEYVDVDLLCAAITRELPSAKRSERICTVLKSLPKDVSCINVLKELVSVKKNSLGVKIAGFLSTGRVQDEELDKLLDEFRLLGADAIEVKESETFVSVSVKDILHKHFTKEACIELWPEALNNAVEGQCKPGHHILVFAPTEMGKTLIVINMVAGFVAQKKKVLYIGNEDPAPDLYMRFMTRMTRMNKYEIQKDPDKAQRLLDERNYGLLVLKPLAPGNFFEIRKLVDEHKPDIVILDQLRNLDVRSEGRTQQLEKAATEARNLAKSRRVLVVSVTQAGDSASGKAVLGRGDVDSSNVGIPGQVDLMIGIGATSEQEPMNLRTISLPKNKMSGNHNPFNIEVDPLTSRVVE